MSLLSQIKRMFKLENDFKSLVEKFEVYLYHTGMCLSRDTEEYVLGHSWSKRSILWAVTVRLGVILTTIRVFACALLRSEKTRIPMMNSLFLFTDEKLASTATAFVCLSIILTGVYVMYQEMAHQLIILNFLYMIKHRLIQIPFARKDVQNLVKSLNFLGKYVLFPVFYLMVVMCCIIHFYGTCSFYFTLKEKIFSGIALILWNLTIPFFAIHAFSVLCAGFAFWYFTTQILSICFKAVNIKIDLSVKLQNYTLLTQAIHQHNYYQLLVHELNKYFRMVTLNLYYVSTIGFQLVFFIIHKEESTTFARIIASLVWLCGIFSTFSLIWLNTHISCAAHQPYSTLIGLNAKNRIRMSL